MRAVELRDARPVPLGDEVGVEAVLAADNVGLDLAVNGVLGGRRGADDEVVVVQVEPARSSSRFKVSTADVPGFPPFGAINHEPSFTDSAAGAHMIHGQLAGAVLGQTDCRCY